MSTKQLAPKYAKLLKQLFNARVEEQVAKSKASLIGDLFKRWFNNGKYSSGSYDLTITTEVREVIDAKKLKARFPEVYKQVRSTSKFKKASVSKRGNYLSAPATARKNKAVKKLTAEIGE